MVCYGMVCSGTVRYGTVLQEDAAATGGRARDARPTIVFTTIDHPIMREWAAPGMDVEVFPSGLVLDKMDSSAVSEGAGGGVGLGFGLGLGLVVIVGGGVGASSSKRWTPPR